MLLLAYDQLRVEKLIEDEVRARCCNEAMTDEFSQFEEKSVLLAHDQLMVEKPIEGRVRSGSNTLTVLKKKNSLAVRIVQLRYQILSFP